MKTKNKLIIIAAAVIAVSAFTACGSKENTDSSSGSETVSQSVSETVSETTASEAQTEEVTSVSESESVSETEIAEESGTVNPLMDYADAALNAVEWPFMEEVTDKTILSDYFLLDADNENYRNLLVMQCPMSANMSELIIIEAEDAQSAADDLKARRDKAKNGDAFYPADVEKAEASIVGTSGDYAYFIMCSEPEKAEEALLLKPS